ncbi:MAG TPA: CHASE3 domain-containing protein [Gemmatimonadaceae bacterium]|nr:CHASE3 domain-containing protein [Gemmatimonadaceae bacterium]
MATTSTQTDAPGLGAGGARRLSPVRRFIAVGGVAIVLLVLAALTFDGMQRLGVSRDWVARSQQVVARVEMVLSDVQDAETGQRGFLLTGEERYLEPYRRALATLAVDTAALRALTRDNPRQQQRLDALQPLIRDKLAELERTIVLRRDSGTAAAVAEVRTDEGRRAMMAVRSALTGLAADERALLRTREASASGHERLVTVILLGGTLIAVVLAIVLNGILTSYADSQAAAAHELALSNAQLQDQALELEAQKEELESTTEELEQRTVDLERARAAADAASHAKSQFVASMSHEIRTPINAVVGYTDLLEMGLSGPITEQQRQQLGRIRASSRHLLGLVNEVLDLAKVESGTFSFNTTTASAEETLDAALALVRPQAAEHGIAISGRCEGAPYAYVGDEDRVRQILVNLLSNAVKFTEAGGRIMLSCGVTRSPDVDAVLSADGRGGSWLYVRVQDTGIGIAPDHLAHIFEPFVQVDSGYQRARDGTGLGLTISRQLARLMGGDLTARSTLGNGSVFTLWLPAPDGAQVADSRAAAPRARRVADATAPAPAVRGIAALGLELGRATTTVTEAFVDRMRREPEIPQAAALTYGQLADHTSTLVTEFAEALIALEESPDGPSPLLADGTAIQRLVAERHGRQRAQLGWSDAALAREYTLLREAVVSAVRQREPAIGDATAVQHGLALLTRFFEQAEAVSRRAFALAVEK